MLNCWQHLSACIQFMLPCSCSSHTHDQGPCVWAVERSLNHVYLLFAVEDEKNWHVWSAFRIVLLLIFLHLSSLNTKWKCLLLDAAITDRGWYWGHEHVYRPRPSRLYLWQPQSIQIVLIHTARQHSRCRQCQDGQGNFWLEEVIESYWHLCHNQCFKWFQYIYGRLIPYTAAQASLMFLSYFSTACCYSDKLQFGLGGRPNNM